MSLNPSGAGGEGAGRLARPRGAGEAVARRSGLGFPALRGKTASHARPRRPMHQYHRHEPLHPSRVSVGWVYVAVGAARGVRLDAGRADSESPARDSRCR